MNKRKITAREVLSDVRTGVSDPALMEKYKLSAQGLQSVFNKLIKAGVLTQEELNERVPMSERTVDLGLFICPACGNIQGKEFAKCPRCGFVSPHVPKDGEGKKVGKSSKLLSRRGKKKKEAAKTELAAAGSSAAIETAQPEDGESALTSPTAPIKGYCQTMGIVSMAAYIVLVVCLFVIVAVTTHQEFPSVTEVLIGVVAIALAGIILLFVVLVTLRALNQLAGFVVRLEQTLFQDSASDEE